MSGTEKFQLPTLAGKKKKEKKKRRKKRKKKKEKKEERVIKKNEDWGKGREGINDEWLDEIRVTRLG